MCASSHVCVCTSEFCTNEYFYVCVSMLASAMLGICVVGHLCGCLRVLVNVRLSTCMCVVARIGLCPCTPEFVRVSLCTRDRPNFVYVFVFGPETADLPVSGLFRIRFFRF